MPHRTLSKAHPRRASTSFGVLLGLLAAGLYLPGCDNPACIFGGDCNGTGGGGVGANPASIPVDGTVIDAAPPRVLDLHPSGDAVDSRSPVVVVFSESMAPTNLNIAFELIAEGAASGAVPFGVNALLAEGRVLVLMPLTPLLPTTGYTVRFREGVAFQDLTGQVVTQPADRVVGTFGTGGADPVEPTVVFHWPEHMSTGQSAMGELLAIFSRPMSATTVSDSSFLVTINGAAPAPPLDLSVLPLSINNGLQTELRVFRAHLVDAANMPVPFPNSSNIDVRLSPAANPMRDTAMPPNALVEVTFEYDVAAFGPPASAVITSNPTDSIGIDQLSGPANLAIQLAIPDGQSGDSVQVTLFGTQIQVDPNPPLIALQRLVPLAAPFTTFTLAESDLDLVAGASPLSARFADGTVGFAFQLKRGTQLSPARMLDTNATQTGAQSPVLDTVAPTLTGLGTTGTAVGTFRSDLRDLAIVGRASEALRSVLVETPANGDNDVNMDGFPPVAGAHASGLFVAGPVQLGLVSGTVPYTVTIFDRALNSGGSVTGTYRQLGASGPGALVPGADITVDVYDESTLAALDGATVFTHANLAGTVTSIASSTTLAGSATVASSLAGETLLTVFAAGYDLFSFQGVLSDRMSIPLAPTAVTAAGTGGLVATTDLSSSQLTKNFADARAPEGIERLATVSGCSFDTTQSRFECPYGPVTIRPREIGAQSAFAIQVPTNLFLYSPLTFLHGFELALPLPTVAPGASQTTEVSLPFLLSSPVTAAEERAIDGPPLALSTVNYASLSGTPRVTIEARAAGLRGTPVVGQGVAFDLMPPSTNWGVRAAYAGAVDGIQEVPTDLFGRYVKSRTIDADLMVRVELLDTDGNRGMRRPRFSTSPLAVTPPAPAVFDLVTPIALNVGGEAYDVLFADVLPDAIGQPGLYRVTLTDAAGRRWRVFVPDSDDASGPNVLIHLPLIGTGTTFPLAAGDLDGQVAAYAWPTLDAASLLWTDVEREFDHASLSKPQTLTPP